jgi:hypothetical protein
MRSMFPGQFRPTADDFKTLWSDCIFGVDANVLLNLYRYSPETRRELERALTSVRAQLFIPHQAAKEFLKNRLTVTAGQAEEYTKAIRTITDLTSVLSNKKKHPFLPEAELPKFSEQVKKLVDQLQAQQVLLLDRLVNDEILEFVQAIFENKTGAPLEEETLSAITADGERRYQEEIPPGYKDGKKDASGDPYRKYGDLIVWRQLILKAKSESKPVIFVTDDKKEDWWLEQSGRTIGPRTELREEFISEVGKDFWMYTVDKFIEEAARSSNTKVSAQVIEEIIEVRQDVKAERIADDDRLYPFKAISRQDMLDRLEASERWAADNSEGFLGLVSYVKNYLGHAGYDYSASFDMIRQLQEEGLVEVYEHQGEGHERSVRAIRLTKPSKYSNRPLEGLGQLLKESQSRQQAAPS